MQHVRRIIWMLCIWLLAAVSHAGGSATDTNGRATVTVRWPENSRRVSVAANSIRVKLVSTDGRRISGSALLVRPPNGGIGRARFDRLPIGALMVLATGYPSRDGSGSSQAGAQIEVNIVEGQDVPIRLTLDGAIQAVTPVPASIALGLGKMESVALAITNATGETVLVAPGTLVWKSLNTSVAAVDASGIVRSVGVGATTITVAETVSGQKATIPVTVAPSFGPVLVYENEFDKPVGPEWSSKTTSTTPKGNRPFLGEFGRQAVTLSLSNLPGHGTVTVSFKLFVIRTWDGNRSGDGPDVFKVNVVGGATLLETTFSNVDEFPNYLQSYPMAKGMGNFAPFTGASEIRTLGFVGPGGGRADAVYELAFTFPHTARAIQLRFEGLTSELIDNESWGLASVRVSTALP